MNSRDVVLNERIFALFKGDPGCGKSIAAVSFPDPYVIDNDRRMKSVINFWRPRGKEFDYDFFDSPIEVNKKLEEFQASCPYKTLIYDGITTGSRQILATAKRLRGFDPDTNKFNKTNRRMVAGTELSQIEDYQAETTWFETIINNLKYLSYLHGINVIVTAHVLTTEQTDIKKNLTTTSRTLLTAGKKVAAGLPVDFDEVWHFDVRPSFDGTSPQYTVVTQNTGWDYAKTALPIDMRIDFTNASLYDKVMEQVRRAPHLRAEPEAGLVKKETW